MTPTSEQWQTIVGYEGYYQASDLGRIRSLDRTVATSAGRTQRVRGRVLAQALNRDGRPIVSLHRDGRGHSLAVSSLVMRAFRGSTPEGLFICHDNGDPLDNRLANLRWDDQRGNMQDRIQHGRNPNLNKTRCPRGHRLAVPNLRSRTDGRECLACSRARPAHRRALRRGLPSDFAAIADAKYALILDQAA